MKTDAYDSTFLIIVLVKYVYYKINADVTLPVLFYPKKLRETITQTGIGSLNALSRCITITTLRMQTTAVKGVALSNAPFNTKICQFK